MKGAICSWILLVVGVLSSLTLMAGCSTTEDYTNLSKSLSLQAMQTPPYRIQSGDILEIKFPFTEKHNEEVVVRPDGCIALQVAGEIRAVNLTPEELAREVSSRASERLKDPVVTASVKQSVQKIYVGGEVGTAGAVPYREGMTALQAIFERGGFRDSARSDNILLVRMSKDDTRIKEMRIDDIASYPLSANDLIYVPKTDIAKANLAVKQFVRDMLPFSASLPVPVP